ncbi:MAG: ACP S-malonyltransferase [Peptostreptococcaceae bacterium]
MNKIAFLFPGQGAQYIGMGKEFYENIDECKELFDKGQEILGYDVKSLVFGGEIEELTKTKNNQPAILLTSLMCQIALKTRGIDATHTAGLSLGEYGALIYSGVLRFEDGVFAIKNRASIMDSAVDGGSMAAVLRMDKDGVNRLIDMASEFGIIEVANYNCPGQIVISGETSAIKESIGIAKGLRGICKELNVSGPFHSSLYEKASFEFLETIKDIEVNSPNKDVYSNLTGEKFSVFNEETKAMFRKQIMSSVLFEDIINNMINDGVDTFIELGPGKVLSGFIKKINKEVNIYNVEDLKSLDETVKAIKGE